MAVAYANCLNPIIHMNNQFESTYALLVRSEEKGRGVLETVLYAILILSAVFSISQFALHSVKVPAAGLEHCIACETASPEKISAG
jgi:hypothetical protein